MAAATLPELAGEASGVALLAAARLIAGAAEGDGEA